MVRSEVRRSVGRLPAGVISPSPTHLTHYTPTTTITPFGLMASGSSGGLAWARLCLGLVAPAFPVLRYAVLIRRFPSSSYVRPALKSYSIHYPILFQSSFEIYSNGERIMGKVMPQDLRINLQPLFGYSFRRLGAVVSDGAVSTSRNVMPQAAAGLGIIASLPTQHLPRPIIKRFHPRRASVSNGWMR